MQIVYTNRVPGEQRVHIELTADDTAWLAGGSLTHTRQLQALIEEADHRLNPEPTGDAR